MREEIITNFFTSLEKQYQYGIIHHVKQVFDKTGDIDLVVGCNKSQLKTFMSKYCFANNFYYLRHTIDLGTERYNLICFENTQIIRIELDITYSNRNILGIDVKENLKNVLNATINGKQLKVISNRNECSLYIKKKAFKNNPIKNYFNYFQGILPSITEEEILEQYQKQRNYFNSFSFKFRFYAQKVALLYHRILEKPSKTICFLGPDGSGKTTIIEGVRVNNPYINFKYYHLKPKKAKTQNNSVQTNPHGKENYSQFLSVLKLVYFVLEYNVSWIKNVIPKKITPILIVFDRYFDDLLADPKRYRYGGSNSIARFMRKFIPRPSITFILDAPVNVILNRKKEVSKKSLTLQLEKYRALSERKNVYLIDVNRSVDKIIKDVVQIILNEDEN